MAEMLVLEFSAPDAVTMYERVNRALGVDVTSGGGDWPPGMLHHLAGGEGESLVVVESWQSREAQERFMRDRLQPAFAQAQVPQPRRVTWLPQVGEGPK